MNQRPVAVTLMACLLIAAGLFGLAVHFKETLAQRPFHSESLWIVAVPLLALASGVFILLGHNWARWLALAWMAFHVAISFFNSLEKVVVHVLFFMLIAYSLFRRDARAFFERPDQART